MKRYNATQQPRDWYRGKYFGWIVGKKLELSLHSMILLARQNQGRHDKR